MSRSRVTNVYLDFAPLLWRNRRIVLLSVNRSLATTSKKTWRKSVMSAAMGVVEARWEAGVSFRLPPTARVPLEMVSGLFLVFLQRLDFTCYSR